MDLRGKKILMAEDNETNALVFSSFLEDWNCLVTIVTNGEDAVAKVREDVFDLVLMDIYMPKMNGTQAIEAIRLFNPSIPIIVLTASTLEQDIRASIAVGANNFLLKPISSSQLKSMVEKYCLN